MVEDKWNPESNHIKPVAGELYKLLWCCGCWRKVRYILVYDVNVGLLLFKIDISCGCIFKFCPQEDSKEPEWYEGILSESSVKSSVTRYWYKISDQLQCLDNLLVLTSEYWTSPNVHRAQKLWGLQDLAGTLRELPIYYRMHSTMLFLVYKIFKCGLTLIVYQPRETPFPDIEPPPLAQQNSKRNWSEKVKQ